VTNVPVFKTWKPNFPVYSKQSSVRNEWFYYLCMHCTGESKMIKITYYVHILSVRSIKCTKRVYSIYMFAIIFYLPLSFIMMMILLLALCLRPVHYSSIRNCVCTAFYLQFRNDDKRVLLRRNKRHLYCKYVAAGFFDPSVLLVAVYLSD
jgi:hypothetical protein